MMLLADIDPVYVYAWTMAHSIDAFAWNAVPNVYGVSQFADGGGVADKPSIYASNHLIAVSDYKKDRWCDVWDGLYWRFIDTHRLWLKKNPRFGGLLVGRYDAMEASRKRIIGYRAQDFLDRTTVALAADVATE
jgi:deoxyribodipyrimidine photolyase-related protein